MVQLRYNEHLKYTSVLMNYHSSPVSSRKIYEQFDDRDAFERIKLACIVENDALTKT